MHLTPGSRVGPYEVVVLLGAGGMADVYRARDTRLGRDVAIKVVSEALGGDGPLRERFEREARLAGSVSHPNVVALYDVGFQDGKPYLVTELLRGETLRERVATGPVPLATALEWAAQMAQGLAAAHDRGIIHRDLKLENVFITEDGHVKLLDFGIAKLAETPREPHGLMEATGAHSGWRTGTGIVLGTPGYMSPEQVRGESVDARTDFFSLGALLYEMLTARQAFPAHSVVESGYAVLHAEPEALPASIPLPVAHVVRRCLEKDPAKRFQSARDLAFHLELLRTPTGSRLLPSSTSESQVPSQWSRRWPWLLVGLLAAVAISATTYFISRPKPHRPLSVERITSRRGMVSGARFDARGDVVYSALWGAAPQEIFTTAGGDAEAQSLGLVRTRLLSVSPNGELAIAVRRGPTETLALVSVGGVPREVTENILFADWSPGGDLAVVRNVNGKSQLEYPLGNILFESTGAIAFPRISPAGDLVAFWTAPNDARPNELLLVDRKGSIRHLTAGQLNGLAWAPNGQEVWFTQGTEIWASPLSGERRLVYQGVSDMELEDIAPDGKLLVVAGETREEIVFFQSTPRQEHELPWLSSNENDVVELTADGRRVLFIAYPKLKPFTYVRPTDGSPPLKLGPGRALAFSPDEKWVVAVLPFDTSVLSLLPVGVGSSKLLPVKDVNIGSARWLRDGKRLVVMGQRKGETQWRLLIVSLDGGALVPLSDSAVTQVGVEVSHDDRFTAAPDLNGTLTVYPLDGTPPIPLPELGKFAVPAGWSEDGQLWVAGPSESSVAAVRLRRYDLVSRRVVEERTVVPTDVMGITGVEHTIITPDGRNVAVQYMRKLGSLYTLDGLSPPVR